MLAFSAMNQRPASSTATAFQPQPPITAAFFYPWYPSHWLEGGTYPFTNYTPSLGLYSSTDEPIVTDQLALARQAHIDAFISSWWEPGEVTDIAFQDILRITESSGSPIRWSTYYEREGYANPSPAQIGSDLQYLDAHVFASPAYLRVNGKPVVFAYGEGSDGCATIDRWLQAEAQIGLDVYVVLKVFEGYSNCPSQPDSWHQYSPTSHFDYQPGHSVTVSPGFWKIGQEPLLTRNAGNFEYAVQWMAVTNTTWRLITTWNEWAEGTSIEPALEYRNDYIDILCRNLPGPEPCTTATPAPTAAPTPPGPTPTSTPPSTPTAPSIPTSTPLPSRTPTNTPSPPSGTQPSPTLTTTPQATAGATATPTPKHAPRSKPPRALLHGDTDCSQTVDSLDALRILRRVAVLAPAQAEACAPPLSSQEEARAYDVNCDGVVGATDSLAILRYVAGLSNTENDLCPVIGSAVN
jgi:hypothetical protein